MKLSRIVTAPVRAVKRGAQLVTIGTRASRVLDELEAAKADPALYRQASWQGRLFTRTGELLAAVPIAEEVRVKFQDYALKAALVLGSIGGLAGYLADQGVLALLPPKVAATIGVISGGCATVAALLLKSPISPKPAADK
jgi:hypothetical protein